jgi:signal-transduction protein with cAMP-binding, CBS, and nucleotidyltransferase domain
MTSKSSYPPTAQILPDIPARDLLLQKSSQLWSIAPESTVYEAIELMAKVRVGAVLVLNQGALVGILSERDYARKVILEGRSSQDTRVESIMTKEVIVVSPDTSLQACMQLMTSHRIRHLPVVEQNHVVGVVSIGDVVRETLAQQSHALEELQRYVTGEPRLATGGSNPSFAGEPAVSGVRVPCP